MKPGENHTQSTPPEVEYEITGSAPNFSVFATMSGTVVGRVDFDVRDFPPLHLALNSRDEDARNQAELERDRGGSGCMIWLSVIDVIGPLRGFGIATAMLDTIYDEHSGCTVTNSTSLSDAGEGLLRAWLKGSGCTNERLLWRGQDGTTTS